MQGAGQGGKVSGLGCHVGEGLKERAGRRFECGIFGGPGACPQVGQSRTKESGGQDIGGSGRGTAGGGMSWREGGEVGAETLGGSLKQ